MADGAPLRIGFIGNGGITRSVREALSGTGGVDHSVVAILARSSCRADEPLLAHASDLIATAPAVVIECAGHGAVREYGEDILRAGIPLILVSTGALADAALQDRLIAAARAGGTAIILAPGAMAGIEALAAARIGGLTHVRYVGSKPPLAWRGTPAEDLLDLANLASAQSFFRGTAREAALAYPKNSNVCATIALAGLGFERTDVELRADPGVTKNVHHLSFAGADGQFAVEVAGEPSRTNPKTSALTAHSIARLVIGMASPLVI